MADSEGQNRIQFKANDTIFREGEAGDAAYMVTKGAVDIRIGIMGPSPKTLTTIKLGGTFGELALCLDSPRTASAIATEETELLTVSRVDFLSILSNTSPIVEALMLNLGRRIVELTEELEVDKNKVNWHQWKKDN